MENVIEGEIDDSWGYLKISQRECANLFLNGYKKEPEETEQVYSGSAQLYFR